MLRLSLKAYIGNVFFKLAALTFGTAYVSRPATSFRRYLGRSEGTNFPGRAALVAHVFYPDLLGEIRDCFDCFPQGSDLLLTAPPEKMAAVEAFFKNRNDVQIISVENRGRDIAPFIFLLNKGLLDPYDAVLKIHTKKSPHLRDGNIRRRLLYATMAGSRRQVAEILDLFRQPTTGLVGWRLAWRRSSIFWMSNRARVHELTQRMQLAPPLMPAFFEGSMFWVRPLALQPLRELNLCNDDFEAEAGQLDGTLHHAVERIFDSVIRRDDYVTLDTNGRQLI